VTLCIAALADGDSEHPKIVLCSDMLLGDDYQHIETIIKTDLCFSDTLASLYSGVWEDATNLDRVLRRIVRSQALTLDNYRNVLAEGWKEFETTLAERASTTDAQCILAGFIEKEPRIIRIQRGSIDALPFFTSIGIGAYHADTIFSWRKITQFSSLEQVLYFMYEAKRFGELCRDVGKNTLMYVVSLTEAGAINADIVMAEGLNIMDAWFRERFGPRPVGYDLSFSPTSFHTVKLD
jgi:hypothetical protein